MGNVIAMMRSSRALRLSQIRSRPSHVVYRVPRPQSVRNGYCTVCESPAGKDTAKSTTNPPTPLADHRQLGIEQELFTTSVYSPGSPLFLPNGAKLFNRLTNFLRAQYDHFGFQEVITPTIYKKSLWEKSGHWDNYADDMYSVTGRGATGEKEGRQVGEDEEYGLKPMNCPGHCLIFASKQRSWRIEWVDESTEIPPGRWTYFLPAISDPPGDFDEASRSFYWDGGGMGQCRSGFTRILRCW